MTEETKMHLPAMFYLAAWAIWLQLIVIAIHLLHIGKALDILAAKP